MLKNETIKLTIEVMNDAGLLRQYIAERFGQVLTFGGSSATYFRARRLIKRLQKLTGLGYYEILEKIKDDYAQISE